MIEHLRGCVPLIHLHLQHRSDHSLGKHDMSAVIMFSKTSQTVYNVRLPSTNLGTVRHIVPVRCWEIKQALQNLLEESFLVIAAAAG